MAEPHHFPQSVGFKLLSVFETQTKQVSYQVIRIKKVREDSKVEKKKLVIFLITVNLKCMGNPILNI